MPIRKTAYIDESMRVHQGLYVLVAVTVADTDAEAHRDALRALLLRGQTRLHWRDESTQRRSRLITDVPALPHTRVVVICEARSHRQRF
jgi:GTP cyclohydrolase III